MIDPRYKEQVRLLLQLLPAVFKENGFFLKGGTAINFFVRDVPRLSVDIDLVYGIVAERHESLSLISEGMERIVGRIRLQFPLCRIQEKRVNGFIVSLFVGIGSATVTIEMNTILRGFVFPCQEHEISRVLLQRLNIDLYVTANTLSNADLYGGKICAALDRQHPRDLFDIKILFDNEGITDDIRKAFIVYLASHDRPMAELLAPKRLDVYKLFESEFVGMTDIPLTYEELVSTREQLVSTLNRDLTSDERRFLFSIKMGEPEWNLLGIIGIEQLPALKWKLANIKRMPHSKHTSALEKLRETLNL
jgi:predicted nucleotidyltransferase component of viral defense system